MRDYICSLCRHEIRGSENWIHNDNGPTGQRHFFCQSVYDKTDRSDMSANDVLVHIRKVYEVIKLGIRKRNARAAVV